MPRSRVPAPAATGLTASTAASRQVGPSPSPVTLPFQPARSAAGFGDGRPRPPRPGYTPEHLRSRGPRRTARLPYARLWQCSNTATVSAPPHITVAPGRQPVKPSHPHEPAFRRGMPARPVPPCGHRRHVATTQARDAPRATSTRHVRTADSDVYRSRTDPRMRRSTASGSSARVRNSIPSSWPRCATTNASVGT
jgi:hypothetical protein